MFKKTTIMCCGAFYVLSAFSSENSTKTLDTLMQDFEKNKTTKVTVLFDKCSITGDKIPVEVSSYNQIVFYISVNDVVFVKKNNESYIGFSKYLSMYDPGKDNESGSESLSCNRIKIDKNHLILEATLNYYKNHKNNYNSYSQNYKCPIDDKNIVTFTKG